MFFGGGEILNLKLEERKFLIQFLDFCMSCNLDHWSSFVKLSFQKCMHYRIGRFCFSPTESKVFLQVQETYKNVFICLGKRQDIFQSKRACIFTVHKKGSQSPSMSSQRRPFTGFSCINWSSLMQVSHQNTDTGNQCKKQLMFGYYIVINTKVLCQWHFLNVTAFMKYDRDL